MTNYIALGRQLQRRLLRRLASRPPRTVYHYTTQAGLLGIVRSGALWGTDIRYLNDSREYDLAVELARSELERVIRTTKSKHQSELARRCIPILPSSDQFPCYVASFSERGDLLSQWRAYAGVSGYAVGMSVLSLERSTVSRALRIYWFRCIYEQRQQLRHVRRLFNDVSDQYFTHRRRATKRDLLDRLARSFARRLAVLASCIKDVGFQEEREWRLVRVVTNRYPAPPPLQFRAGARNLIPFTEYKLATTPRKLPLTTIVVGPSPHLPASRNCLALFLQEYGLKRVRVVESRVPFRDW